MEVESDHEHAIEDDDWPFEDSFSTAAFSSKRVLREAAPVLVGVRDHDGDWQFLHGEIEADDEIAVVCLACLFERDRTVGELADLEPGWIATRERVGQPWIREPYDHEEE